LVVLFVSLLPATPFVDGGISLFDKIPRIPSVKILRQKKAEHKKMEGRLATYGKDGRPRLLLMSELKDAGEQAVAFSGAGFEVTHAPTVSLALQAVTTLEPFDVLVTKFDQYTALLPSPPQ
jgi:hypothetical protein